MRLLVTGGAGFIGSHYVRTMLAGGYPGYEDARITVVDRLSYAGNRENLPARHPRLDFVHGDVCDLPLLLDVFPGHDALVHFAAESHVDRSVESAAEFVRTNVGGTQTVLDACVETGIERVVHVSTDEVYGSIETGSWTESRPLLPNSPYAASKAGADLVARSYWRTHRLGVSITRCSNNYGPTSTPRSSSRCSSPTSWRASLCPSTGTAATSVSGCTSTTTAGRSTWSSPGAGRARSTTSAAATRPPTWASPGGSSSCAAPTSP